MADTLSSVVEDRQVELAKASGIGVRRGDEREAPTVDDELVAKLLEYLDEAQLSSSRGSSA